MSNQGRTLFLLFIFMFLVGCNQEASDTYLSHVSDSYGAFGMGQTTCPEYTEHSENDNFNIAMRVWLEGYFTSVNMFLAKSGFEIDDSRIVKGVEFIKTECAKTENTELWVPTVAYVFWRSEFKKFKTEHHE